jgi:hypothetical protein
MVTIQEQQLLNYSVQKIEMKKLARVQEEIMKLDLLNKVRLEL